MRVAARVDFAKASYEWRHAIDELRVALEVASDFVEAPDEGFEIPREMRPQKLWHIRRKSLRDEIGKLRAGIVDDGFERWIRQTPQLLANAARFAQNIYDLGGEPIHLRTEIGALLIEELLKR
jgi:hypothetical protein